MNYLHFLSVIIGFFYSKFAFSGASSIPIPSPPAGTPELPGAIYPFLIALGVGGVMYWRKNGKK